MVGALPAAAATHYPGGSLCYDCHAVSRSKMVVGTHLLKRSPKTIELGITGSSTPIRCLFCHERDAVSATGRTEMLGVWDHFDARSTSRHPADPQSVFGGNPGGLDCQDCHTGITVGVVSDGAGNARVHGVDAATEAVDRYATLIGSPTGPAALSASTCQAATCHDADGSTGVGGYAAPARHGLARATLPGGGAPSACTQCHGTHNSYQNTALVVLRTDGTTSNSPTAPLATVVTPEKCAVCHPQDDAGVYAARGHGQPGINAGTITCTSCHTAAVPHRFSRSWPGTNRLRFAFAENTSAQSSLRAQPPYQQAYSICLTCHSQFAGKLHQGPTATAGCNDCHEPHGAGVGANAKMIRAQVPKVDAAGTPVYGDGSGSAYETNTYVGAGDAVYKADGTSLCDNAECHQGRTVNGDLLYPLTSLLSAGRHSGGDRPLVDNCASCHTHTDPGGSWGAKNACLTCHGQPPPAASPGYTGPDEATTAHRRHAGSAAGQYGYGCATCHSAYPTGHRDGTYQSVAFGTLNPSGAYVPGTRTCAGLYCHSAGQSAASTGSTPAWESGALTCRACHGGIDPATRIATGSHAAHLIWGQITCTSCHADTVSVVGTDASTSITGAAAHVNGLKNLRAGGSFGGQTVAFAPGTGACAQISCHGGNDATWGATLSCADCHLRPAAAGGDRDNFAFGDGVVATAATEEWTDAGHGRPSAAGAYPSGNPAAALAGPAADPRGCAYCHAFLGTANNPAVAHGAGANPFRLANQSGTAEDNGWNNVCLVCHRTSDPGYDPDGASAGYTSRNGARNVDENHYGAKHSAPSRGGTFCWDCHDPHGDAAPYMVHSGDGSAPGRGVTDVSDGAYGVPVSSRPVTGFTPATSGYTSDDLVNPGHTGLCQTCHATSGGTSYYNRASFTDLDDHNGADATRCTLCHRHASDFTANCAGCHGSTASHNWWPDGTAEHGVSYANRPGAHQKHIDAIYGANAAALPGGTITDQKNQTCGWCHPLPGGIRAGTSEPGHDTDAAPVDTADVHGDGRTGALATGFKSLTGQTFPAGAYDPGTHVCANIACHGGAPTPSWYFVGGTAEADAPAVSTVRVNSAAPASIQRGTPTVALTATCTDAATGGGNIVAAEYFVGAVGEPGTGTPMAAADGLFDSVTEAVSAAVSSGAWHADTSLYVVCRDAPGNWGPAAGGAVTVTLTAQNTFTAALANGATESVFPGSTNRTVAVLTFTFLAGPSPAQLSEVTITGTGTGSPSANVSVVKVYRDTGSTANAWDSGDTLLGTGTLNAANVAAVAFPATVASGTPLRLLVTYDITAGAVAGNTLGAQLTAVATAPTTALTTPLPLSSANVKTVATSVAATHYPYASSGTAIASAGQTATNYAACGTAAVSRGSFYTLLSAGTPTCNTVTTWTNTGGVNQSLTAIFNTVLDATRSTTVRGSATGNRFYVGNGTTVAGSFTVHFVGFDPATGTAAVIGTGVSTVVQSPWFDGCCQCWVGGSYLGNVNLSAITGSIPAGHKLGLRITVPDNGWWVSFGNTGTSYLVINTLAAPVETTPPALSVAPAATPAALQSGTPTVTLTATCSDVATGGSRIVAAEYFVGTSGTAGTGSPMVPASGAFGDPEVAVTAVVDSSAWIADTTLHVDCKDGGGTWGPSPKGTAAVVVTPKDDFTVAGSPGPTEMLLPGEENKVVQVLTFAATGPGASVGLQGVQITGSQDLGSGQVHVDVSQARVYNDTGAVPSQWDASDVLLGASAFGPANVADVTFVSPITVTNPAPVRLLVTYDVAGTPTAGDRIGAVLTGVTHPPTDRLATALPIASGNVKTISAFHCGACHGLPPDDVATGRSHAKHAVGIPDHTDCNPCHPGASGYTNGHADGKWQLSFSGNTATFGVKAGGALTVAESGEIYADPSADGVDNGTCTNTGCHGAAEPVWGEPGSVTCAQCHGSGASVTPNAPTITAASPHVDADGSGLTWSAGDCTGCHGGHRAEVTVPLPPTNWSNVNRSAANMRTVLGINYTRNGGIHLGGPGTAANISGKTTEAEICWGCHDGLATPVSEWGYNVKTTPAGFPVTQFATANDGTAETFNFGWLYTSSAYTTKTSDWTAGYWTDQYDTLIRRRVASVHTASFAASEQSSSVALNVWPDGTVRRSSPVLESKGHIRCSYCHDVHDTFGPNGRPYLRGTWMGNPYPPELPPRPGYPFTTTVAAGTNNQPRGLSSSRDRGGYFIDQNSGNPTLNASMDTLAETAGLCSLCHGTAIDSMDYYSGSKLWLPGMANGHSNSTLGGTRSNARDLFSGNRSGTYMQLQNSVFCGMRTWGCPYPEYCFSYVGTCISNSGWYGTDYANWYGTGTIGGAFGPGSQAHKFTCSKCHTPHASGLPALLTQNCVDPAQGGYTAWGYINRAGNCHRKTSTADGWHILAPGQ